MGSPDELTTADEATLLAKRVGTAERIAFHAASAESARTELAQIDGELALRGLIGSGGAADLLISELLPGSDTPGGASGDGSSGAL